MGAFFLVAIFAGCVSFADRANSYPSQYQFRNVVDTSTPTPIGALTNFLAPSVSGQNTAFVGIGQEKSGIFISNHLGLLVAAPLGPVVSSYTTNGISFSGSTAVYHELGTDISQTAIIAIDGQQATTIATSRDVPHPGLHGWNRLWRPSAPAISGNVVAYVENESWSNGQDFFDQNLIRVDDYSSTVLASRLELFPMGAFGDPVVYGSTLALPVMFDRAQTVGWDAIYKTSGGPLIKIVRLGDPAPVGTFQKIDLPSLSDTVAFRGFYDNGFGIFVGNGGPLTAIAKSGDAAPVGTFYSFGNPSVGGSEVAFFAYYGDSHAGIFRGSGGPLEAVIKWGDPLFGSVVTDLGFGQFGLDQEDARTLAFRYLLQDGRAGVAIATLVPEPCSTTQVVLAMVATWVALRRQVHPVHSSVSRQPLA